MRFPRRSNQLLQPTKALIEAHKKALKCPCDQCKDQLVDAITTASVAVYNFENFA